MKKFLKYFLIVGLVSVSLSLCHATGEASSDVVQTAQTVTQEDKAGAPVTMAPEQQQLDNQEKLVKLVALVKKQQATIDRMDKQSQESYVKALKAATDIIVMAAVASFGIRVLGVLLLTKGLVVMPVLLLTGLLATCLSDICIE